MKKYFTNIFLFFSFLVLSGNVIAQVKSPAIDNISFVSKNEQQQIEISYDIIGYSKIDEFTVSISAFRAIGEKLNVSTTTGDLFNVKGGLAKKIIWQQRKDGYVLDEPIYFVISAANKVNVPLTSHLVKSVLFPGWGDYRLRNNKFHFVYGLAGYSSCFQHYSTLKSSINNIF